MFVIFYEIDWRSKKLLLWQENLKNILGNNKMFYAALVI